MANIKVNTGILQQIPGNEKKIAHQLSDIEGEINHVIKQMNTMSIASLDQIKSELRASKNSIASEREKLFMLAGNLEEISSLYERTENNIKSSYETVSKESFWDKLGSVVSKGEIIVKTGVAKTVEYLQDCVSWWVESYKEKGTVYKVIQTGKAVLGIAAEFSSILLLWGVNSVAGGVGTPLATLGTIYACNGILNNLADIRNCWWGDVEQIGEVDLLKTAMQEGGAQIGNELGNEELGKVVGEGIYTFGSIFSTIVKIDALVGKVIQAPDMWSSIQGGLKEMKTGMKGLWDIATHSDIGGVKGVWNIMVHHEFVGEIGKDLALLKYEVPSIVKVMSCIDILKDVKETTSKLIKSTIDTTESILKYRALS